MTLSQFKRFKNQLAEDCYRILAKWCPYDTGDLLNSVLLEITEDGFFLEIPMWYTVYTNEVWINRDGDNPNEGWIQDAFIEMYEYLNARLSGIRTRFNYDELIYNDETKDMVGQAIIDFNKKVK